MSERFVHLYLPLFLLGVGSLAFILLPWDMQWAQPLYDSSSGWKYAHQTPWGELYKYGVLPALVLCLSAFTLLMLGIQHPLRRYRKVALYFLSCMALGPGLITNGILKGFWGRPRPKQLEAFGGSYDYETLLTIDLTSFGKSFPCGHATMGFYFFALGFVLKPLHRWASRAAFLFAWGFGLFIGMARFVQGGHFPSDTLWAAGVCWFVSYGLYYAFRLNTRPLLSPKVEKKRPWWMLPTLTAGLVAILFVVSLATPYDKRSSLEIPPDESIERIVLTVQGETEVKEGTGIKIVSKGYGHRFPKSRHRLHSRREGSDLVLSVRKTGFFTELVLTNTLTVPQGVEVVLPLGD